MGYNEHTQPQQHRSAVPLHDAPESIALEGINPGTVFARVDQAAAEARRRNSEQREGTAAWIPTRLATGDWAVRRSRILVVRSATGPEGPRPFASSQLDAAVERYGAIVRRIAAENHVRRQTARRWFEEMLKFLDVCYAAEETVSPSPKVDKAWHVFLLFTRDYASYCHERFGCFIHHEPMGSSEPAAYKRAHLRARLRYGELDPRIWPRPSSKKAAVLDGHHP